MKNKSTLFVSHGKSVDTIGVLEKMIQQLNLIKNKKSNSVCLSFKTGTTGYQVME
jgi:hypothetical protein